MKTFLLAAGLGLRLRPLTDTIPKCMMPIDGKPLLHYWLALCKQHNITDILINLHHLPQPIIEYTKSLKVNVQTRNFTYPALNHYHQTSDVNITLSLESELIGSAGTVRQNADWIESEKDFIIAYADNLTNANLTKLLQFHRENKPILTMGLFHSEYPQTCGIVSLDENGKVTAFEEKPRHPKSNLANAGIYITSSDILAYIPTKKIVDFGYDVLPQLIGKMYAKYIDSYLYDISTPESYKQTQAKYRTIKECLVDLTPKTKSLVKATKRIIRHQPEEKK